MANTAPSAARAGKVSRSTETGGSPGMRQHLGLEHVGAGVDEVGRGLVGGFSTNSMTRPSASVGTTPNRRVVHRLQVDGGTGAVGAVEGDEGRGVHLGEDVSVHHEEGVVDAGVSRHEGDGAGGVEQLDSTA